MAVTPDILTPAEAARISRYSVKTIYRAIQSGRLRASRPTARYRIRSVDLVIWLGTMEVPASAPLDLPPPSAPSEVGSLGRLRALEADAA